jgi:hypothetical protein
MFVTGVQVMCEIEEKLKCSHIYYEDLKNKAIFQHNKTSKFLFMCWFTCGDWMITVSHGDSSVGGSSACPVVCRCVQQIF